MKIITLETVENGFILRPFDSFHLRDQSTMQVEEIYVFRSLDEVNAWLVEHLAKPKE